MSIWYRLLCTAMVSFNAHSLLAQPPGGRGEAAGISQKIEPKDLTPDLGTDQIPDRETFAKLSYQGPMRMDSYLSDIEFVKFIIENSLTENFNVYWMNTNNFQAHPQFMGRIGMGGGPGGGRGRGGPSGAGGGRTMRGAVSYMPRLKAPDGSVGLYIFDFQPNDRFNFEEIKFARDAIVKTMPFVKNKLAFHPLGGNLALYQSEKQKYDASDVAVYRDEDIYRDIGYLPLNESESFGRLRLLENDIQSAPRDIVICKTLPNQMPRTAGVISAVRQTPLSHVNLRAVQDKIPNAYIADALTDPKLQALIGKWIHYKVDSQGYSVREATQAEVDSYFEKLRPAAKQSLSRDLTKQEILKLDEVHFEDGNAFGVKAANIATMLTFGFPEGTIPNGMAIPFYFYDEFMKHNHLYEEIQKSISTPEFQADPVVQDKELARIRKLIKNATMPDWMMTKIETAQRSFPENVSIRCRSSTNNEDLPGFSGAGLYDSFTHKPDEGHLSSTIKEVYASLWNFRAFEEREFYRVDHMQAAMGVLMHPNYKGELSNGVAVTDDILYQSNGNYYVNTQVGEDLVTNPEENASPEELLLAWYKEDGDQIVRPTADGKPLLTQSHMDELRNRLAKIHQRFRILYGKSERDQFAMEIEFKISAEGKLVIKQARPWVF